LKICTKCKEKKDLTEFAIRKSRGKHEPTCRSCKSVAAKLYRQQNKEKLKQIRVDLAKTFEERLPESKVCSHCELEKSKEEFGIRKSYADGLHIHCKECSRKLDKEYYERRKEEGYKRRTTESAVERAKKYYILNKDRISKQHSEYRARPDAKVKATKRKAKRRASEINATPKWLTKEHDNTICEIYRQAKTMSEFHEEVFEVDHIEPLQGKTSCGLHVPWNLQILPLSDNRSKRNRLIEINLNLN
jgi:hypothetical protein